MAFGGAVGGAQRLLTSLDRMEETVSNVLDTARIDEGKLAFTPEEVNLGATIREVTQALDEAAKSKQVRLVYEAPDDLTLRADPRALGAVLRNLVVNGVDAAAGTPEAEVKVIVATSDSHATIEVRDNGRGAAGGALAGKRRQL